MRIGTVCLQVQVFALNSLITDLWGARSNTQETIEATKMNSAAVFSRIHSHLLGVALVAAGIGVHAAEPYVESSLKSVASHPKILAMRASYSLAVGDMDSALLLAKKAAEPSINTIVLCTEANHVVRAPCDAPRLRRQYATEKEFGM